MTMAKKESTSGKAAPVFDGKKCSKVADELSALITGIVARCRPQSIAEGLLIMTLAMGRVLQVLGTVMGCDPKRLNKEFCDSLTRYFDMGGDKRIDHITEMFKQKGN